MTRDQGVVQYVSPRERDLTPAEQHVRNVAYALKRAEPWAIREAVSVMKPHVPRGASLVPIPSSQGDTRANRELANALARVTNSNVVDALSRKHPVEPSHARRQKGLPGLHPREHGMRRTRKVKEPVIFIDNVMTTGSTFHAARRTLGTGKGLAYAHAREVLRLATARVAQRFLYPRPE